MWKSDIEGWQRQLGDEQALDSREELAALRREKLFPHTASLMQRLWPPDQAIPASQKEIQKACTGIVIISPPNPYGYEPVARYTAELVSILVQSGARLTLLDLDSERQSLQTRSIVTNFWPEAQIGYERIEEPIVPVSKGALALVANRAYCLYEWLKNRHFDVVHAPDFQGCLYFCLRAKEQGIAFAGTRFVVHPVAGLLQRIFGDYESIADALLLPRIYMEQSSLELADNLPVPGKASLSSLLDAGAEPAAYSVEHVPLPHDSKSAEAAFRDLQTTEAASELKQVLCLPGASRRGIALFCKALNRNVQHGELSFKAEFAVPASLYKELASYAKALTSNMPGSPVVHAVVDRDDLAGLLGQDQSALCVLPVLDDWNRYQLLDLAAAKMPVLVADPGAAKELLDQETAQNSICAQLPDAIARHIRARANGQNPGSRLQSEGLLPASWASSPARLQSKPAGPSESPLVTVCLMHFERAHLLEQALDSVERQTYPNLEVVLVDDGSLKTKTIQKLEALKSRFQEKGWQVIQQQNRFLGAARNTAAMAAKGRYLYFLDDDNILKPQALATLVGVAEHMQADVVAALSDAFEGQDPPETESTASRRIIQIGDDLSYGIFRNSFGDSNALVRRSTFLALGGNTEDYAVGKDDQEFFARAVLNGCKLTVVPEALYWARQESVRLRTLHFNPMAGHIRVCRAYLPHVPPKLRPLLLLSSGLMETSFEGKKITFLGFVRYQIRRIARSRVGAWLRWGLLGPARRKWREWKTASKG